MLSSKTKTCAWRSSALALMVGASLLSCGVANANERRIAFDIPAENTARALNDFSQQSGVQILFPYDVAAAASAPAVRGNYTREEALTLLMENSGLEIASQTDRTISLRKGETPAPPSAAQTAASPEVVVTGTRIRGGNPTSPVHTVTRRDIDQSGYSQIGDVMRSLPENFSGGQNPGVIAAATTNVSNTNLSSASTVNLRGLGTDATLVLVNGHRLSSDGYFQATDISGIPLAAVQRIEVVPDGASALYGSDAVAGVANIILRRNYDGAEISTRLGTTAQGGGAERTLSALAGRSSVDGYLLGSLEYSNQDPIFAPQRAATAGTTPGTTLLPSGERKSLFLSAGRTLNSVLSVTFDAIVSDRRTEYSAQDTPVYPLRQYRVMTPGYSAALGLEAGLGGDWKLRVSGVTSGSRNSDHFTYPAYNYSSQGLFRNALQYMEVTADGTAFTLPSGDVKVAVGGGTRHEAFVQDYVGNATYQNRARDIRYAYGELYAPLVARSETRTGLHELELNLSGRTETYSDFGSTTNPKVGVRYVPISDVTLRATWGKSFKAPTFLQMYGLTYLVLRDSAFVGGPAGATVLMTQGSNADLKPERSTSTTVGIDYRPAFLPSLAVSATWFDIDYTDRVVQPVGNITTSLSDPIYAPFVERNPSTSRQNDEMTKADVFYNFASGAYDPANVIALVRDTYANATAQSVKGMDLSYRQTFQWTAGTLSAFANATWMDLSQQTILTAPTQTLSGTIFNVPDLKARGGLNWRSGGLSATTIVNYVSSEIDTGVTPNAAIASWTTLDASIAYTLPTTTGWTRGVKLSLAVSNLFDKAPPYAESPARATEGIHYDSTNASIIGRFVSLTVSKAW